MSKVAIVTGGTSGIGKQTALALKAAGYTVYELSRRAQGVEGLHHLVADITREELVDAAIGEVLRQEGHIDVVVNNAGFGISGAIEFTKTEDAKRLFDADFFGMVNVNRAVIPHMRQAGAGRIVNLSSVAAAAPIPFQAYYSAAKAGLIGLTKALAKEEGPSGITVNCVAPGVIDTDMMAAFTAEDKAALAEETPVGRLGSADEVAQLLVFLAGESAGYITGQVFGVNGGLVI